MARFICEILEAANGWVVMFDRKPSEPACADDMRIAENPKELAAQIVARLTQLKVENKNNG